MILRIRLNVVFPIIPVALIARRWTSNATAFGQADSVIIANDATVFLMLSQRHLFHDCVITIADIRSFNRLGEHSLSYIDHLH
ncbi:hypothetical protein CI610_02105 [invertebrate metagenome]|uniref:Uncharacterized protein n=1 Tax=invertebrate metagenome TaxID=1711999 RepID=A0A2H9T6U1_9ZZZZ